MIQAIFILNQIRTIIQANLDDKFENVLIEYKSRVKVNINLDNLSFLLMVKI